MLAEIELNRPDVIVITELFPKTVKATDLNIVEFQLAIICVQVELKTNAEASEYTYMKNWHIQNVLL